MQIPAMVAVGVLLAACSRDKGLRCASDELYREAVSAGTLRVPGDLSVPDEAESLIIPSGNPGRNAAAADACLDESPALTSQPRS